MANFSEPVFMIGGGRSLERPRADQTQHGAMLEPKIIRTVTKTVLTKIIGPGEITLVETVNDPLTHAPAPG